MKNIFIFLCLLIFAKPAFAIKVIGNGGDVVSYPDGRIEMLDLYEARDIRKWKIPDFTGKTFEEIAEEVLSPLKNVQPERAERWYKAVLNFEKVVEFSKDPLPNVEDSRELFLPRGAVLKQAAILNRPSSYKVFEKAWKDMTPLNRFILALHETIYMEAVGRGAEDSILVRVLVGKIVSGQMTTANEEGWVHTAVQTRLQSFEILRSNYRVEILFNLHSAYQKATEFSFNKGVLVGARVSAYRQEPVEMVIYSKLLPKTVKIKFDNAPSESVILLDDQLLQVKSTAFQDSLLRVRSSQVSFLAATQKIDVNSFSFTLSNRGLCTDGLFMTTPTALYEEFFRTDERKCLTAKNLTEGLFIKNASNVVNVKSMNLYLTSEEQLREFFFNAPLTVINAFPVKVSNRYSTVGFKEESLFEVGEVQNSFKPATAPVRYVDAQTDLRTNAEKDSVLIFNVQGKLVGAFCVDGFLTAANGKLSGTCLYFDQYSSGKWR